MNHQQQTIEVNAQDYIRELLGPTPFSKARVLLIGDTGLDEYVSGRVQRISPEAPVPILEVQKEEFRLGLSGNVAHNIISLGGQVDLISVVGKDQTAERLKELLLDSGVNDVFLLEDLARPTTRKTRFLAEHQQLVRVDFEVRNFLSADMQKKLAEVVKERMAGCDLIIIQDYSKGVLNEELIQTIVALAHKAGKKIIADPHRSTPAHFYRGVDYLKPNFQEAVALSGLQFDELHNQPHHVTEVGKKLQRDLICETVIMTRSKEGMMIFSGDRIFQVPTYARQVFDVTGAGDTAIATLALSLAVGFSLEKAAVLANYASGVVVGKVGCVPCHYDELQAYMRQHQD